MTVPTEVISSRQTGRVPVMRRASGGTAEVAHAHLLVSVRSVEEAECAVRGGVDILDVKEPLAGSLGMASVEVITQIVKLNSIQRAGIPVSVALGEVADWLNSSSVPSIPAGISFAKLGLSRMANRSNWRDAWRSVCEKFEQHSASRLNWVAVAYADVAPAAAPHVGDVLEAAITANCAGLLIDTWKKGPRTLLDDIEIATLAAIAQKCHANGLFFAIAGKISRQLLPSLAGTHADVFAIRSAACREYERTSELDADRVAEFRLALHTVFGERQAMTPE